MLQQTEWNQFNTDIHHLLSPKELSFMLLLQNTFLKGIFLLAKDTKHIQEKGTLNAKYRKFFRGAFFPPQWISI